MRHSRLLRRRRRASDKCLIEGGLGIIHSFIHESGKPACTCACVALLFLCLFVMLHDFCILIVVLLLLRCNYGVL
jgi:hypothetical protein